MESLATHIYTLTHAFNFKASHITLLLKKSGKDTADVRSTGRYLTCRSRRNCSNGSQQSSSSPTWKSLLCCHGFNLHTGLATRQRQKSYSPVTGNRGRRSEWRGQIFDRKLVNRRFCACAVKKKAQNRLLCCQIAKILAPL